jgi:hypothetical protein
MEGAMTSKSTVHLALLLTASSTLALTGTTQAQQRDPAEVGQLSPLIPLPKDAIHAGLSWTEKWSAPLGPDR